MINFRLFGIEITVHMWFWITMALFGAMFNGGLQAFSPNDVLPVALFIIAGFLSVLVHELGHAIMIKKYQLPTEIHLIAFGGFATHPVGALTRRQSFIVSIAGPAFQIALGLLAYAILLFVELPETQIMKFIVPLAFISVFWAVINLIPVYPLDGGQMLAAVLGPRKAHITYLVGVILPIIVIGVLLMKSIILPIGFIFLGFFAYQNWQRYEAAKP